MKPRVLSALERLQNRRGRGVIRGPRVGLVTHPAAVDSRLRHSTEVLASIPGLQLLALFGPEHGLHAHAQDLIPVDASEAPQGPRYFSLYGATVESLRPTPEMLAGLDVLVIDLQDVGTRCYTFLATTLYCLEAATEAGLPVIVLDRPNPIGGRAVEGPLLRPGFESFVGPLPVCVRHGMTLGELANFHVRSRGLRCRLTVEACGGLKRQFHFDQTRLPWVMPSPNMPSPETALVYPGQVLIEGTNLSEGRGTTRPFEICGAPWLDPQVLARRLREQGLPGVHFRPCYFQPTFQKFAGQVCGGVQLHVLDREAFQPVRTGLTVVAAMRELSGERFAWRTEPYEFVHDIPAFDLLLGSDRERRWLEAGKPLAELFQLWEVEEEQFRQTRREHLIYPE